MVRKQTLHAPVFDTVGLARSLWLNRGMALLTHAEFERIVDGILEDREPIIKHNPIGTRAETLLWMLLSCLVSYLSLTDAETPCFTGIPDAETYREAIRFIVRGHAAENFDPEAHLARLSEA